MQHRIIRYYHEGISVYSESDAGVRWREFDALNEVQAQASADRLNEQIREQPQERLARRLYINEILKIIGQK